MTPLALLTLPTSPNGGSDLDMKSRIVVVLPAHRTTQEVFKLFHRELAAPTVLPGVSVVIQVLRSVFCKGKYYRSTNENNYVQV